MEATYNLLLCVDMVSDLARVASVVLVSGLVDTQARLEEAESSVLGFSTGALGERVVNTFSESL